MLSVCLLFNVEAASLKKLFRAVHFPSLGHSDNWPDAYKLEYHQRMYTNLTFTERQTLRTLQNLCLVPNTETADPTLIAILVKEKSLAALSTKFSERSYSVTWRGKSAYCFYSFVCSKGIANEEKSICIEK